MLRAYLSKYYYRYFYSSPLGQRLRRYLKQEQLAELKPFAKNAVISDLFALRLGNGWSTSFQLFNISSFLFPELNPAEHCEIHIFNANGILISKRDFKLSPYELKTIDFNAWPELASLPDGLGSFCVFHFSAALQEIAVKGSRLTERGYVSYRYKGQDLHNYCHGNLQSLSKTQSGQIKTVVGVSGQETAYYPQMLFSDCNSFDLVYTNPTTSAQEIKLELFNNSQQLLETKHTIIPARGIRVLSLDNKAQSIHTIKNLGKIIMWRPLIFKNYATHFDVLHG